MHSYLKSKPKSEEVCWMLRTAVWYRDSEKAMAYVSEFEYNDGLYNVFEDGCSYEKNCFNVCMKI